MLLSKVKLKKQLLILLKNDCLVFSKENLYESRILTGLYRNPKRIVDLIKGKRFDNDIEIFYILDKRTEAENLKKVINKELGDKVKTNTILTRPEIEILYIVSQEGYSAFTNKNPNKYSASEYVKIVYKEKNIKSERFVRDYFSNHANLLKTIKVYNKYTSKKDLNLYNLLKEKHKK